MLVGITGGLIVLTALHDLDHVRQGRTLGFELYVVAVLALATTATVLILLLRRHGAATLAAGMLGLITIGGVAAVHVAPERSFFSDSYGAAQVDALSWIIIILMMLAGLAMALIGLWSLHRNDPDGR